MADFLEFWREQVEPRRYVGRVCHPKENGLLYFALNSGYIQLDKRHKWEMEYVPDRDTCFMRYIKCDNCHFCGETKLFLRRAIVAWNRRADNGE